MLLILLNVTEKLKTVAGKTGAILFQGDTTPYFLATPSCSAPAELRLYSLAGTLAEKVRVCADPFDSNCQLNIITESKHIHDGASASNNSSSKARAFDETVGLIATKNIQDGDELRISDLCFFKVG